MNYKENLKNKAEMLEECLVGSSISLNEVTEIKKLIKSVYNVINGKLDKMNFEQRNFIIDNYNNALDNMLSKYVSREFDFKNVR